MKKCMLALVLCLTLCIFGCAAMADGGPTLTLTGTTVEMGKMFEATVGEVAGAGNYYVRLMQGETEIYGVSARTPGKIWLATTRAEVGSGYTIVADAKDENNQLISSSAPQAVSISGSQMAEGSIDLEIKYRNAPNDPLVGTILYASAYAPGADRVYIVYNGNEVPSSTLTAGFSGPGDITLSAVAVYENDGAATTSTANPITIHYQQTEPAGTVSLNLINQHIVSGQDIVLKREDLVQEGDQVDGTYTFSFNNNANARLVAQICESADERHLLYAEIFEENDIITIPATELTELYSTAAYTLYLFVEADDPGYGLVYDRDIFTIEDPNPDNHPEGYEIGLLVNGESASVTGIRRHDYNQRIQISAHPVEGATLEEILFYHGTEVERLSEWGEWNEWINSDAEYNIELTSGFWTDATFVAHARYRTDNGDEIWSLSNVVVMTLAEDEDQLPGVDVTVPRTVVRGDWLNITINEWPESVEWFYLDLNTENDEHVFHADSPENRIGWSIPTVNLEPGYYHVTVGNGAVGMGDGYSANAWFHVLEADEPSGIVWNFTCDSPNGPTAETMEPFTVSVYAPGAAHIDYEMELDADGWYMQDSNYGGDLLWLPDWSFPKSGTLTITVHVFDENGEETAIESRTVAITAADSLDKPELTIPESVTVGSSLPISFTTVDDAENYYLRIVAVHEEWHALYEENYSEGQDLTLSGDDLGWLQDGGLYTVYVEATARNYDSAVSEVRFVGTAPNSDSTEYLTLTVNGSPDDQEILSSTDTWVKLGYDESHRPTAVRVLNNDNWDFWWGEDSYERNWGFGDGELLFYAEATWDDIDFEQLERDDWKIETDEGWREFDWFRDVHWTGKTNIVRVSVTSPNGRMAIPQFSLNKENYAWGEDLIVTIPDAWPMDTNGNAVKDGWFFGHIFIQRTNDDGNTWWDRVNHNYDYWIYGGENRIPTYNLEPNSRYQIEIGSDAEGYSGDSHGVEFTLGAKPDDSTEAIKYFTVNGVSNALEAETNVDLILSGYLSGAEWYDVEITRAEDEKWYNNRSQGNGMLYDEWNADEAGVYTLTAYGYGHLRDQEGNIVKNEDGDDEWRELIGTVTVTATAEENLDAPDVAMADKAYVGDILTVHFNEIENAETYSFWVHREEDDEWLTGGTRHSHGDLTIDTRRLPSGIYWVELDVEAPGYNQSHSTLHFALLDRNDTDHSEAQGAYYFTISTDSVETEEGVHIIAYVPGAENAMLYCSRFNAEQNEYGELEEIASEMGPGVETWFGSCDPGKYGIYLRWEADGWSEPVLVTSLQITNPHGNLAVPSININGSGTGYTVQANADDPHTVTITIPEVPYAESYDIWITPINDGRDFYHEAYDPDDFEGDQLQLTITDDNIEPGRMYEVFCEVHAQGYAGASTRRSFLLQGSQPVTVTLSVEEEDEYWTAMPVQVHAEAQDATAILICMNNEQHFRRGNEIDEQFTIWDQDTLFYAFATENQLPEDDDFNWDELDLNWTMQSNPIYIYAETEGPTQVPTMNVPEAVTRGEWLVFTIDDNSDARQFDARIRDENGNEMEFRRFWATGVYMLPTANLEAGRDYRINLSCIQDHYMWNEGDSYWFHVNAPAEGQNEAFFRVDKTALYPGEAFIPTVYAPGAIAVKITDTDNEDNLWGSWDGDSGTNHADWEWWFDDAGTPSLTAYALYEENGEWVEIDTVSFQVEYLGTLTMDRSGFPPYMTAGSTNVKLNFSLPENAEGMNIGVFEDWDDDEGYHRNEISEIRDAEEDLEITIPATNLISGHRIIVDYHVYATGYKGDGGSVNIPIIAAAGSGARMVIEEGYLNPETGNALVDSDIRFHVEADEGYTLSAVRVFNGNDFWNPDYRDEHPEWFPEGKYEFEVNYHDTDRVYTVYAEVQLAGSEAWITTNAISFGLDMIGEVGAYDFTDLSDITVQRGQNFTVTFTEAAHANRYWADMFDEERGYNPATVYEGRSVTIATANLSAGVYELWGRAGGDDGWRWTESTHSVRVTVIEAQVPASGILLTFNKNEVETLEMFTISVYAPGAERVKLCHQEAENAWMDMEGDSWSDCRWLTNGNGEQTFYAFAMFNGAWSDPVIGHINLIAEGDAPAANVTASATAVEPGETIQVHVALPEGAVRFDIAASLERGEPLDGEDNYTDVLNYGVYDYDRDFVIQTTEARNGDVVWVTVWTYARGMNCRSTTIRILMTAQPNLGQVTFRTPVNLTEIGEEAFEGIAAKVVQISDHVTMIGHRAFAGSQIEQIVIPDSVTQIEGNPFEGCRNVMVFCSGNSYAKTWADEHDETIAVVIP